MAATPAWYSSSDEDVERWVASLYARRWRKSSKRNNSSNWVRCTRTNYKKFLIYILFLSLDKFSIIYRFIIYKFYIQFLYTNLLFTDPNSNVIIYGSKSIYNYLQILYTDLLHTYFRYEFITYKFYIRFIIINIIIIFNININYYYYYYY